jgi:SAM-dependent methyltransferase
LISQTISINPKDLPQFYQEIYWPLIAGSDEYLTPSNTSFANDFILNNLLTNKFKINIFEVGCGSGHRLSTLKDKIESAGIGVQAYGCDYSADAVKKVNKLEIIAVEGGFNELKKFGVADILIMSHVFEHMPDLNEAMKNMHELIHENSIIYIEVPGVIDLEHKREYAYDYQDYCVLAHNYNFSLGTLANVLTAGGFKLVSGDEYVRAIFKIGSGEIKNEYHKIISALSRAQIKSEKFIRKRNNKLYKFIKSQYIRS